MPSTPSQHFDVAVVGMQLSGIIAAALLAKRGRRVMLVDHGENTSSYRRHGLTLPLLPSLLPCLDQAPHVQRVHDELGIAPQLRGGSRPQRPAYQAVLPQHRLDVDAGPGALVAELRREFPEVAPAVEAFVQQLALRDAELGAFLAQAPNLPAAGLWERARLWPQRRRLAGLGGSLEDTGLLAAIPPEHPVRALLLGPLCFFGHLWPDGPGAFHAVRLMGRYLRGVAAIDDGANGLGRLLLGAAERAGVEIHRGAVVGSIAVGRRRLTELEVEGNRLPLRAQLFVSNTVEPFYELLSAAARHPRFVMEAQRLPPSGSLLVLNVVVRPEVIPRGMGTVVFLLDGHADGAPPMLVQRFVSRRGDVAPAVPGGGEPGDREILSLACPVRLHDVAHTPGALSALKEQALARLRRLVPFVDDFVDDVSLPLQTGGWDVDAQSASRRVDAWRLHPLYDAMPGAMLGVCGRPARTYFRNLVHCGRDVIPGLGLEGEYIAGAQAARTLQQMGGWR